jgi:hypothetical protein
MVTTVEDNKKIYSQREQADAEKALSLCQSLGYPSSQSLIDMLNTGAIVNAPVTAKDVARATRIFGPSLGTIRGKTRKNKVSSAPLEYLPREISSQLVLHVDIMFISGTAYLISVSTPLGLTMVNILGHTPGSRSLQSVRRSLFEQLDMYKSRSFTVVAIKTDNEGSIVSLTTDLNARGITVNTVGAGSHVPVVERKIQEVKERARAILHSLPYNLGLSLMVYLIMFVTSRINLMPHRAGLLNISPSEAFRGRKIDYKRDLRLGFGEYCEVFDPRSDNTMRARTQAAISLMPSGNASGSVKFLSLASGKTIVRDQFTKLPCTDIIINQMNDLAVRDLNIFKSHKGAFAPSMLKMILV